MDATNNDTGSKGRKKLQNLLPDQSQEQMASGYEGPRYCPPFEPWFSWIPPIAHKKRKRSPIVKSIVFIYWISNRKNRASPTQGWPGKRILKNIATLSWYLQSVLRFKMPQAWGKFNSSCDCGNLMRQVAPAHQGQLIGHSATLSVLPTYSFSAVVRAHIHLIIHL